jgi:hypothetical protein
MAYMTVAVSTIAGLLISSTFLGKRYNRGLTLGHEAGSVVGLLLLGVHAWAILDDSFFTFPWRSLVVPGGSPHMRRCPLGSASSPRGCRQSSWARSTSADG